MPSRSSSAPSRLSAGYPRRFRQSGMALVITLLLLLITTIIIVAFFSRARFDAQATASYSGSVQVDLLASGAADQLTAEFLREIQAGSSVPADAAPSLTWYEPRAVGNKHIGMVPTRPGLPSTEAFRNLIKQSSRSHGFYADGSAGVASAISSSEPALNGRAVRSSRWDLPALLGDAAGVQRAFGGGLLPAPDWIYLKTDGATTTTPPKSGDAAQVAGRYAFNVYDVGGLLNVNVAGHRETVEAKDVATKGAAALADLSVIPGLDQVSIDKILAWRAPHVDWQIWLPVGKTPSDPINQGRLSLQNYLQVGSFSGWLKNPSLTAEGQQFLSRRDLIKFFKDNNISEDALPYLTHFSVDADAPSFTPDHEALKVRAGQILSGVAGAKQDPAGKEAVINPSRAQNALRVVSTTGKTETIPVLRQRFPLSRLALVATDPEARQKAGATDTLTKKYFGLVSGPDPYSWRYKDENGSDEQNYIKTLEEVAQENREPNFFEILKSVIQVGSLGQFRIKPLAGGVDQNMEPFSNRGDDQIIRIGAAIIDQADRDSFPTRIRFDLYSETTRYGEIQGVEDLPYIMNLRLVHPTARISGFETKRNEFSKYILMQPTLWNPHNPLRRNAVEGLPTKFRVTAFSASPGNPTTTNWAYINPPFVPPVFDGNASISFDWTPTSKNFEVPQGILSTVYPTGAAVTPEGAAGPFPLDGREKDAFSVMSPNPYQGLQAVGFSLGNNLAYEPTPPVLPPAKGGPPQEPIIQYMGGATQFVLQYSPDGGEWYDYDHLWFAPSATPKFAAGFDAGIFFGLSAHGGSPVFGVTFPGAMRIDMMVSKTDPRSQRFMWPSGLVRYIGKKSAPPDNIMDFANYEGTTVGFYGGIYSSPYFLSFKGDINETWTMTTDPIAEARESGGIYRADIGILSVNSKPLYAAGKARIYYADADGVTRRGMGGRVGEPASGSELPAQPATSPQYPYPITTGIYLSEDYTGLPLQGVPLLVGDKIDSKVRAFYSNRPVVLNRPFRSVGELANTFRDVPWKNLDFSFPESGDTGLLDVFTVNETSLPAGASCPLVAGKVNLNTASKSVLKALMKGATTELPVESTISGWEATKITDAILDGLAERFVDYRSAETGVPSEDGTGVNGPLRNLGEIIGRVYSGGGMTSSAASFVGLHPENELTSSKKDRILPERLSLVSRSLADVGTVRTWNVMIDLIAQSGKVAPGDLKKFNVTAESRWWVFLSIDRFTGKVLARSVERVVE